jgi:DNA-binding MarR family transcriptional regulator
MPNEIATEGLESAEAEQAFLLAGELQTLIGKLRQRLREQASMGDRTRSQSAVLKRLYRDGPATVTELARAEGMRSQSMGATIAALQAEGLVRGAPDPADGRQTILSLTPACEEWVRDGRAARQDWLYRSIRAELSPSDQQQVKSAVDLLNRLVASQTSATRD